VEHGQRGVPDWMLKNRQAVIGDWRKLRKKQIHDLYCSLNIG
jgi:hypothetical protein